MLEAIDALQGFGESREVLQQMTDGRLDASILRQLLIALAMIVIMLLRPRGLWPTREHGKALQPSAK